MSEVLAIHGGRPLRERPWPAWPEFGEEEREALSRVLDAGIWGGHPSPNVEAGALGAEFASYTGANHAVPCANGTVALLLARQAARLSPGAEVITTAYSFVTTAGAISQAGLRPVPFDVSPETYCIDADAVEAALPPRTEAILPVENRKFKLDFRRVR